MTTKTASFISALPFFLLAACSAPADDTQIAVEDTTGTLDNEVETLPADDEAPLADEEGSGPQ